MMGEEFWTQRVLDMAPARAHIVGLGASTPIGRNIWSSAAAARAGICGFSEHPYMIDTAGEPMRVARAPWLDVDVEGVDRFCELLFPAIDEALEPVSGKLAHEGITMGLGLALPPVQPGQPRNLGESLQKAVTEQYRGIIGRVLNFEVGHAAGYLALDAAIKSCTNQTIDACLVAGVDSYLAPETLEWVEECDQLHGGGSLNNAWGFIPGEAAGAMLVANDKLLRQLGIETFGQIASVALGRETNLIKTDSVCTGEGLTQAFRSALRALSPNEQIHNVFCDLNGETYRADEYGFTALRTKEKFIDVSDFVAPADCWGDVGAAGGPLHIALGLICHRKKYGRGPLSMTWASSESGERGAAVTRAADAD